MLSTVMLRNREKLIGQRVSVEGNKYGIIKFYGETSFAEGVWCGIELEEAVGENDGMVNDIRYFTCRENHGIFVLESETNIINMPALDSYLNVLSSVEPLSSLDKEACSVNPKAEQFCKFSVSNDPQPSLPGSILNESYTISKGYCCDRKLATITEDNSEHGSFLDMLHFKSFTDGSNSGKSESMFFTDQGSKLVSVTSEDHKVVKDADIEGSYDSDESLGLLPDLLEDSTSDSLIFDKEEPDRELNVAGNLSCKHMEKLNNYLLHELKPSDDELAVSPICNKLNISCAQTSESPVFCNQSMPVCASTPKHESNYSYVIDEKIVSPQNMSNISHISKKIQESYEDEMDLEFSLNKATVIETVLDTVTNMPASAYSECSENVKLGQNILNLTCNMTKPINTDETSLNKTFESLNVLADKCILPNIVSHTEPYMINEQSMQNLRSEQHDAAEFDLCRKNVLNLTRDLVRELDTHDPECGAFSSDPGCHATDLLNTTLSYTPELDKTQQIGFLTEDKSDVNAGNTNNNRTGDILNTTYEKIGESCKSDTGKKTLKCITNLGESKKLSQLDTKNNSNKSRVLSFPEKGITLENKGFRNKNSVFDRNKNIRKSVGCFSKTNATKTELSRPTRRNSFASHTYTSSKAPETKVSYSSAKGLLPKYSVGDGKCSLTDKERLVSVTSCDLLNRTIKCSPSKLCENRPEEIKSISSTKLKGSQESLLNKTISLPPPVSDASKTVVKIYKNKPEEMKSASNITLKGSQESLLNETINLPPPVSDASKTVIKQLCKNKPEEMKFVASIKLKGSQESLLNKTINLPPPVSDASKTVVKKPRNSMQMSYPKKCSRDSCDAPLVKTIKTGIPSFHKRTSLRIPTIREEEMPKKSYDDEIHVLSDKTGSKKPVIVEERIKISRLPQKTVSQKNIHSKLQSSNEKPSSNIARPQSAISALKPPCTRKNYQTPTSRKPQIQRSELAGRATLNDTILVSAQESSKGQPTGTVKHLPSSSKIPSVSQLPRLQRKF